MIRVSFQAPSFELPEPHEPSFADRFRIVLAGMVEAVDTWFDCAVSVQGIAMGELECRASGTQKLVCFWGGTVETDALP